VFVDAARTFGASGTSIITRHVLPIVLPTLLTVATLDFCYVMLAESSLSFLGIGIQPPDVSWGLMVAQGRTYLHTAWWLSFFPGLAIVITTVSATILADLRAVEQVLQLADAGLLLALLVAGGVVPAVLAQVTLLAAIVDFRGDDRTIRDQLVEFGLESVM
jgi:hypothetical protein